MFSLIITIISIALVAALAVATIYYGGAAFTQGSARANAAALVSAAQQITGANTLFFNDTGANAASIDALVPNYLQAKPGQPTNVTLMALSNGVVSATVSSQAVCSAIVASIANGNSSIGASPLGARQYDCSSSGANYAFTFRG